MSGNYRHGLPTAAHDAMDIEGYLERVYASAKPFKGGTFIDAFAGGGRDILKLHKLMDGKGSFIAIDAAPDRIADMLAKKDEKGSGQFVQAFSPNDIVSASRDGKISAVRGEFPSKPFGDIGFDFRGCADFILCNAGIMFVPPGRLLMQTLNTLSSMLHPNGEMILRFSQERADQKDNPAYHIHACAPIMECLGTQGLKVTRYPDLPDPAPGPKRPPFSWIDLHCKKFG